MSAIKRNPCCVIAAIPFVNEMRNFPDDPRLEEMIPPFQGFSKPRSILPTTVLTAYGDAETKRGAFENGVEPPLTQPIKRRSAAKSKRISNALHDCTNLLRCMSLVMALNVGSTGPL